MGRLIDTGIEVDGHTSRILYPEADDGSACVLECSCGWSAPIASYQNSWSIIEVQSKFERHLSPDLPRSDAGEQP
jgi:hypothetical protein